MGDYKRREHAAREKDWMQAGRETFKEEGNAESLEAVDGIKLINIKHDGRQTVKSVDVANWD